MPKKKRKIVPNAVKEKVRTFIKSERGRVSKSSMVQLGAFLGSAALGAILAAKNAQAGSVSINVEYGSDGTITRIRGTYS